MLGTLGRDELADLLGISPTRVTQLGRDGIVEKVSRGRYAAEGSIRAYCHHLRTAASGRELPRDITAERVRLVREQANAVSLKNALARGEMVEAVAVEREWSDVLRGVRAAMLAISSRVRQRLPALTAADVAEIDAEIRAALTETAADV